jgi:cytoskeletal protein RodZ
MADNPPKQSFAALFDQKLKARGFSLKQISDTTGISIKHLEAFAHGRFEQLPPTPYLRGYFIKLGALLGFDGAEWWQEIKHDEDVQRSGKHDILPRNRFRFAATAKSGRALIGLGAAILLVLLYFGVRASSILGVPQINITQPGSSDTRVSEGHVLVMGSVKNASQLTVNDIQVPIETNGEFKQDVSLDPGMNTVTITAKKTLGRVATVVRQVYYDASPVQILLQQNGTSSTSTVSTSTPKATTTTF